jgi:small-conductance mechanosensitive channel
MIRELTENSELSRWLFLVLGALAATSLLKLLIHFGSRRVAVLKKTHAWVLFVWVFSLLARSVSHQITQEKSFQILIVFTVSFQIMVWGFYLLKMWHEQVLGKKMSENPSASAALVLVYRVAQGLFVSIIVLMSLSNIGVDIGALLAGLGVGGIAVALAAQNILGDLLAALSIVLDKPFMVGDQIVSNDVRGTIESIGIKTTRIRSLTGEQVVVSNKDLLESRVQNYKRLQERRVTKKIGVVYGTSPELLSQIPKWIEQVIISKEKVRFERCHLVDYGSSSLDFELVFYIEDSDYRVYMDIQETILLDILKKFSGEKVEFAFPTQSVLVRTLPNASV